MPSYELESFAPNRSIRLVAATELLPPFSMRVLFWLIDPEQQVVWPETIDNSSAMPSASTGDDLGYARYDYLWQQTCLELFVGIKGQSSYREVNLSPAEVWNCYQFDDYRQPDQTPPAIANDIQLLEIQAHPQKLHAIINLQQLLQEYDCRLSDLRFGISSVLQLKNGKNLFFSLQHSGSQADFHLQQDWIATL